MKSSIYAAVLTLSLFMLDSCVMLSQHELSPGSATASIFGKITNPTSDKVYLFGYRTRGDRVGSRVIIDSTTLDAEGRYALHVAWPEPSEFDLKNGGDYMVFNLFLSPDDSLKLNYEKQEKSTTTSFDGKGSK